MNGKNYFLKLIDTAGQEDYERVRRLFYKNAHAFILCYSIDNKASFENITQKWYKELKTIDNWPIPLILVGELSRIVLIFDEIFISTHFSKQN